jgi:flavodoxin
MNCLIVWYSRDGHTQKVGKKLTELINAESEEIYDLKNRKGIINWFIAGRDAMKQLKTEIQFYKDPKNFDLIIIGTPVWAGRMAPAIRTYIEKNNMNFSKVCVFCTHGGNSSGKTLVEMEQILPVILKEDFQSKEIERDEYLSKLQAFAERIKKIKVDEFRK